MDEQERPSLPAWAWILLIGGTLVVGWWLVGLVVGTVFWALRMLFWVVVVGAVGYAVLTLTGRRPGR